MPFGNIMQAFAADAFRGKTVRLRAWIRVEGTEAADGARMWLRVDRPGRQVGLFDNTRSITSSDWQSYEIAGDVEADAVSINIGVMSYGKARVWIDDMSFEIRGQTNGRLTDLALHNVPPAPEGSGDAVLSAAGMPLFFLDMSGVPADSRLGRWLAESHIHYKPGASWQTGDAEANLSPERLSREYDGLIFVEEGHAARGLQEQK